MFYKYLVLRSIIYLYIYRYQVYISHVLHLESYTKYLVSCILYPVSCTWYQVSLYLESSKCCPSYTRAWHQLRDANNRHEWTHAHLLREYWYTRQMLSTFLWSAVRSTSYGGWKYLCSMKHPARRYIIKKCRCLQASIMIKPLIDCFL